MKVWKQRPVVLYGSKPDTLCNAAGDKVSFFGENCPICNSDSVDCIGIGKYFKHSVPTMYCKSCGSYFRAWHCTAWAKEYYNYQVQYSMTDVLSYQIERQSNFIFPYLKNSPSNYKILEIGCGAGFLLDKMRNLGVPSNNLLGIEPKNRISDQAKKNAPGIDIICSTFESWAETHNNYADLIIFSHVLEHLIPPYSNFFAQCRKVLKPGGLIFIEVPHCEYEVRNPYVNGFWKTHIVSFSPEGLRTLLESNGFSIKKTKFFNNTNLLTRYQKQKRIFQHIIFSFNKSYKNQLVASIENVVRLLFLELPLKIYQRYLGSRLPSSAGYIIYFVEKN